MGSRYGRRDLRDRGTLLSRGAGKVKICPVLPDRTGNNCPNPPLSLSPIPIAVVTECLQTGHYIIEIAQ